jgi:hypothetical protein
MIDAEIVNFYNSVKDPSWPDIQSYVEFCRLPTYIKKECNNAHQFQQRKAQLEDLNHWVGITTHVCVYKNLAFVPVYKCAHSYYTSVFLTQLGWTSKKLCDVDMATTKFFGTIMHPLTRWLKGITQWLVQSYDVNNISSKVIDNPFATVSPDIDWDQLKLDLQSKSFQRLVGSVNVGDIHSMPYTNMFGDLLPTINWYPIDVLTDNEVKIKMMNFFELQGHHIQLPLNDQHIHVSTPKQLEVFDTVKTIFFNNPSQIYSFYKQYNNDLKFYYNLVDSL